MWGSSERGQTRCGGAEKQDLAGLVWSLTVTYSRVIHPQSPTPETNHLFTIPGGLRHRDDLVTLVFRNVSSGPQALRGAPVSLIGFHSTPSQNC